jgi:hypothetical protein
MCGLYSNAARSATDKEHATIPAKQRCAKISSPAQCTEKIPGRLSLANGLARAPLTSGSAASFPGFSDFCHGHELNRMEVGLGEFMSRAC